MSLFKNTRTVAITCVLGLTLAWAAQAQFLNQEEPVSAEQVSEEQAPQDGAEFASSTRVFGGWSVHCRTNSQSESCYAETILLSQENKRAEILRLRAIRRDDGVLFIGSVPEGVALDAPLVISVGEDGRYPMPYRRCRAKRCSASDTLDFDVVVTMVKQEQFLVTFFTVSREAENGRKPNTMPVSVDGLEQALNALPE